MSKVYTSAVVIIPTTDKWEPIQEIRKKYDHQIDRWMPHINLLYPFKPKSKFIGISSRFSEICSQIESFEISLKDFKYFEHRHQNFTIWLNPEPNDLIINLQLELLKTVPDCNDINKFKGGFHPHLSVGQISGIKKLKDTLFSLRKSWKELKFPLEVIYFISRENTKTSSFSIEKKFELKKK